MARELIINADDFGYSDERNRGILQLHHDSKISSVSLLVNGLAVEDAVLSAKKFNICTGLHLNLTEGCALTGTSSSLCNSSGYMRGKLGFRQALKDSLISQEDIGREIRSQLQKFRILMGRAPSHIDGHQHVHVLPGVVEPFCEEALSAGVSVTRVPRESVEECDWIEKPRAQFYRDVVIEANTAAKVFSRLGMRFPSGFIGLSTMGCDITVPRLESALRKTFNPNAKNDDRQVVELMVHPGYRTVEGGGGCGEGPDDFACSEDRELEMDVLSSSEWSDVTGQVHVKLVSFSDAFA